ncbi:MAG: DUF4340 domain-containing protein [Bacteroidota bacterium]
MNRTTIFLTILFLILGLVAYFYILAPSGKERETSYKTSDIKISFDSASVAKFTILRTGKNITLENQGGKWMVTTPGTYKANASVVATMVGGISHLKLGSLVSTNPAKQSVYQVDSSGSKFTVTDRMNKSVTMIIGKPGPSYSDFYVRMDGSNDVYLGEGITTYTLNQELKEWRDKSIFSISQDSIKFVEVDFRSKPFTLKKENSTWKLNDDSIATSEVTPFLSTLSNLNADDFVDTIPKLEIQPFSIRILGSAPSDLKFYPQAPDSAKYVVQSSNNPQIFTMTKWMVQQLAKPFETRSTPPPKTAKKKK